MVGILRCGKMLPPQLNLVIEIEFADATTALWFENAGAHPVGATLSTDFEIQNVRVLASQVVLGSVLVESFNRVLLSGRSLVFSYTVRTQQSSVPNSLQYPHNPMKGAWGNFHAGTYDDTVRNIDIAPQLHCRLSHRARAQDAAEWCQHPLG